MSLPSSLMVPSVGSIRRNTVRAKVDLPQPLSPTSPKVSPAAIEKLTPSTAKTCPTVRRRRPFLTGKCFLRPSTSIIGARGRSGSARASTDRPGALDIVCLR